MFLASTKGIAVIARLTLLALAWTQFAYAAHQGDHALSERDALCAICVQVDRAGDAPPSSLVVSVAPPCAQSVADVSVADFRCEIRFAYRSRGPP